RHARSKRHRRAAAEFARSVECRASQRADRPDHHPASFRAQLAGRAGRRSVAAIGGQLATVLILLITHELNTFHPKARLMSRSLVIPSPWLATLVLWSGGAPAAEIPFRADCRVEGGLVLLGDVADVFDTDQAEVKRLNAVDLVPAPPRREKRVMRAR